MSVRRAKILATLGPSSNTVEKIKELIIEGMNAARINMSHGTYETHQKTIENVREASKQLKREVAVVLDLQGPKIRVDKLVSPLKLSEGEYWYIGTKEAIAGKKEFESHFIPTIYDKLVEDAEVDTPVLFDDGLLEAVAIEKINNLLKVKIVVGGELKSNKGINLPACHVSAPSFTDKDSQDLAWGIKQGIDFVAISFVRQAADVLKIKDFIRMHHSEVPVIAKIEKPQAIDNIDEIIRVTDLIMIARGDMGVELGNHLVPAVQKMIITRCNAVGKPVITATQMLESMIVNNRPTRAEASDVANAIWDGTDVVMLSAESASGAHPVEAVRTMSQIIVEAEKTPRERPLIRTLELPGISETNQLASSMIAEKISARWIISVTESGTSCLKMTRFRPKVKVLGLTNSLRVVRRMCLYWGITPYLVNASAEDIFFIENELIKELKEKGLIDFGDKIVITHGAGKLFKEGSSNLIRVEMVE